MTETISQKQFIHHHLWFQPAPFKRKTDENTVNDIYCLITLPLHRRKRFQISIAEEKTVLNSLVYILYFHFHKLYR